MPPNFAVWTLLTHCFFEDSILMLVEDLVAITLYGKLVEPLWGNAEVGVSILPFFSLTVMNNVLILLSFKYTLFDLYI